MILFVFFVIKHAILALVLMPQIALPVYKIYYYKLILPVFQHVLIINMKILPKINVLLAILVVLNVLIQQLILALNAQLHYIF